MYARYRDNEKDWFNSLETNGACIGAIERKDEKTLVVEKTQELTAANDNNYLCPVCHSYNQFVRLIGVEAVSDVFYLKFECMERHCWAESFQQTEHFVYKQIIIIDDEDAARTKRCNVSYSRK